MYAGWNNSARQGLDGRGQGAGSYEHVCKSSRVTVLLQFAHVGSIFFTLFQ